VVVTGAEVAGRLRAVTNFLRELFAITPLPDPAEPNSIAEVWAVPDATYGWAAKDAHYAMGSFELDDDEQLIIEGRARSDAGRSVCSNHPSRLRASKRGFDRAGSVSVRL